MQLRMTSLVSIFNSYSDLKLTYGSPALLMTRDFSGGYRRITLALQVRRPVQDDRYGRGDLIFDERVNEEAPAVGCGVVGRVAADRADSGLEERLGDAGLERVGTSVDFDRHQFPVRREVEQLAPVASPSGRAPAAVRDLPLAARSREALYVDLKPPGLVRGVCDPTPVGREASTRFLKVRPHERLRPPLPEKRQHPQVGALPAHGVIQDVAPVRRPVVGKLRVLRLEEELLAARAARKLLVEVRQALPHRGEDDAAAVGRPDGVAVVRRVERQARGGAARELDQPDVAGPLFRVEALERDALAVGREADVRVVPGRADRVELFARAVEPDELRVRRRGVGAVEERARLRDGEVRPRVARV